VALFKILKGNVENLPATKHEGYMYITEDTGDIYVDISSTTDETDGERIKLNASSAEKVRKISYNDDGSYKDELTLNYDDIINLSVKDWDENDSAASTFIKNRPFYKLGEPGFITVFDVHSTPDSTDYYIEG
jgi:hypothetical protein